MMETKMEAFEYTYSAKKQEEIQRIREKYQPREADKLEQLRQLDRSATRKGTVVSILLGVVGSLVLGIGMCFTMVWAGNLFVPGVILGLAGLAAAGAAYPVYGRITRRERARLAPQILALTEELSRKNG